MAISSKENLTLSSNKLFLIMSILMFVFYSNITNAQKDFYKITNEGLIVNIINNENETNNNNIINTDSKIYLDVIQDNISLHDELKENSKYYKKIHGKFVPITGNVRELYKFFKALKGIKTRKIRIAHYGDSILLGDVISENLRQNFQIKFGGDGIGFLSIKPDDIRMKRTIRQTVTGDWKMGSITTGNRSHFPIGISGLTTKATRNSTVKFRTTKFMRTSRSFKTVRIFYSNANSSSTIKYSFEKGKFISKKLKPGPSIKQLVINAPHLEKSLDINFGSAAGTYFYGVSLETGNGIYVDNFSFKGGSGVTLTDIDEKTMKDFDKYLNYKLVIINFGINATTLPISSLIWYKNKMLKVVKHFKRAIPGASILLVSVGDKSIKINSRFVTDPKVLRLVKLQKEIATETKIAFWNLFEAMGGNNSMSRWVNAGPPLALRDFVHLTNLGGKIIADLITQALMKEYKKMK